MREQKTLLMSVVTPNSVVIDVQVTVDRTRPAPHEYKSWNVKLWIC